MEELIVSSVRFLGALPMFVAAACLILFNRGKLQSAVYNRSRWFIAAATLILGIHQEQPLACFQVTGGHDASRMGGRKQQEKRTLYISILRIALSRKKFRDNTIFGS